MALSRPPYLLRLVYQQFIWRLSVSEKAVYLTFDDGPHPEITPWVLEQLKLFNAKATFFLVGKNAAQYPEIVKQILAEGHSIGNHTFSHLNGWKNPATTYIGNIRACDEYVYHAKLFRPPYGKIKTSQAKEILGNYKIIMWDVLSRDYDQLISPGRCLKIVKELTRNGSVIVFHDSKKAELNLRFALPKALLYLAKKGFEFKAIDSTACFK
ncbi:MAG: polysaccharide deacetylase family protein [Bacteroidetes bacterium]|nr:polysaccharide deacetylase family protein [Bacteroidota bacterium]